MEILRTPEDRFADLPDFPWPASYAEVEADGIAVRMAYVEAGPSDGPVVLLLHGEPSWSFLYRFMIGPLADDGFRVIAPDLIGFGRSDKLVGTASYSYDRHARWVASLLDALGLDDITLFCQDWGGLLGLRIVGEQPGRFRAVVASNTGLPTGEQDLGPAFAAWRKFSQEVDEFPVGGIVNGGTGRELTAAEIAAYDAPFPDDSYKAAARIFPTLVPAEPDAPGAAENRAAWIGLAAFDGPFVTAFGDSDPITRGGDRPFQKLVAGAAGQTHHTVAGAAHFCQEDAGPELARIVADTARAAVAAGD
ncbi:Haloalkane dehalogenase [Paraconexibacter sp. AEG42_29]|uniref:Haloalkane dehalogenase n=1 Tax=Paraconexibacter sp. AEG42_29 TaxID=2997339 RepID=A0AAU7AU77_9ACTN